MARKKGIAFIILIIIIGGLIGSLFGELFGIYIPKGFLQDLFNKGFSFGITPPAVLDLKFLSVSFGFSLKVNFFSVIGIILAAIILRKI